MSAILIAANPYSGAGPNRRRVEALVTALRGVGAEPCLTWDPGERAALLGDARTARGWRCVVAAGGDGTVAEVMNALAPGVPLAVLPIGNENVLARALGFTADPGPLARMVAAGRTRLLDLGRAVSPERGVRLFGLMASAGFDAAVVHRVAQWRGAGGGVRRVRRRTYLLPLVRSLAGYAFAAVELQAEGRRARGAHCVVANLPHYALRLRLAPAARADDGRLDWVVFERPGLVPLARYAWTVTRARHLARRDVTTGTAARVRITAETPVPVQLDGDPWGFTPVDLETAPAALTVIQGA